MALVVPTACGLGAGDDDATTSADAIRGGEAESGYPAVGLVVFGTSYCTGTLIAPDVVLTAAHCVTDAPTTFSITNGTPMATLRHVVTDKKPHPFYVALACPNPTRDIALLKLAEPIPGVPPQPYGAAPPRGDTCTAIGFGKFGAIERRKRSATSMIDDVVGNTVKVSRGTGIATGGDSGGPLVCGGALVATVSCHTDGEGDDHRIEYYQRIDDTKSWIDATIAGWAPPTTTP